MKENNKKQDEEIGNGVLKVVSIFYLIVICVALTPSLHLVLIFIIYVLGAVGFISFFSAISQKDKENDTKDGYYAQYDESYGANADKHEKYLEEKIANEVMKK